MPVGRIGTETRNQTQSFELNTLAPDGNKLPVESKNQALSAKPASRPTLDPKGQQNSSVRETSFSNIEVKGADASQVKSHSNKAEAALIALKGASDHTAFKHLDNLFTGNNAGFTQIGNLGNAISGSKSLTKAEAIALSEEAVAGAGKAASTAWGIGTTITYGIGSASNFDSLKHSVANVPIATGAFAPIGGVSTAFAGIALIKSSTELVRDVGLDIAAHSERKEAQKLLKNYDPASGKFSDPVSGEPLSAEENQKSSDRLKELINKKGADRTRSAGQVVADRLSSIRDVALSSASVTNSALAVANVAAKVTPGLSQALSAVSAAKSTWTAATNIVALNNIQHAAKQAKGDKLLEAIAAHVQQERIYNSRKSLVSAAVNFTSVGLGVAALAAGPGAPAALAVASIVSSAASAAVGLGTTAFELGHAYQLSQRRKEGSAEALALFKEAVSNESLTQTNKDEALKALADPKNIGLAERALIDRLQNGSPEDVKTAVTFLENFGLSKGTISKLKLAEPEKALSALQAALYNDKVKFTLAGAKQSFASLGKVTGLVQFASLVKRKWDQYQAKRANGGYAPYQSLVTRSYHVGTKNLIRSLNAQITNHPKGKVSESFEKTRDKYLGVAAHRFHRVDREPSKIGVNFNAAIKWNPKTGQYDDN